MLSDRACHCGFGFGNFDLSLWHVLGSSCSGNSHLGVGLGLVSLDFAPKIVFFKFLTSYFPLFIFSLCWSHHVAGGGVVVRAGGGGGLGGLVFPTSQLFKNVIVQPEGGGGG